MLPVTTPEEAATYRKLGLWRDETLFGRFQAAARAYPNNIAIRLKDRQLTYSAFHERVLRLANGFRRAGIAKGEIVSLQTPACIEQPLVHMALNAIGAVYLPLQNSFQETEITHLIGRARAVAAIFSDDAEADERRRIYREKCPSLRRTWILGENFSELEDGEASELSLSREEAPGADDIAHIMLSSGTTAMPKISVFTNNNIISMIDAFGDMIHIAPTDVAAALAPTGTGATGYVFPVLPPLLSGATTVLLDEWREPEEAVRLLIENKCTYATAIPTQMIVMMPAIEAAPKGAFDRFRSFNNGGAPLPQTIAQRLEKLMGCRIQSVYGATDGGVPCMVSIDDPADKRTSTVGRVLPGRRVEFRNAAGEAVEPGQVGEICWKTPDKSFGYLNDMEAATAAFDEIGMYRSGDLARMDMEGFISIVGRVKDMILRGGQNISPRLIEDLLITHEAVAEVSVAGMPDPRLGERACAFVVLKPGKSLTFRDAISFLEGKKIAKWQWPERLEIMDELPRSTGGKIAKGKLTEYVVNLLKMEEHHASG
ncbi:MAG: AMP-binding protein [Hyphomonadaceae bacterium]|nr:AMP-binding protein [Hyphomonadaceae bacterium]